MYLQRVFILNKQALKAEAAAPKRCSPPRGFPSQGMDPAFALRASSWCCAQSTAANPERGEVWAPILQFGAAMSCLGRQGCAYGTGSVRLSCIPQLVHVRKGNTSRGSEKGNFGCPCSPRTLPRALGTRSPLILVG